MNLEELQFESGKVSEKSEGPKEQNLGNISENLKKAGQVRSALQENAKRQKIVADLLSLLVKEIKNDKILKIIINFFDKDYKNIIPIFKLFYPFMKIEFDNHLVNKLNIKKQKFDTISDYVEYSKKILKEIDSSTVNDKINLVKEIIFYYNMGILSQGKLDKQQKLLLKQQIAKSLEKEFN